METKKSRGRNIYNELLTSNNSGATKINLDSKLIAKILKRFLPEGEVYKCIHGNCGYTLCASTCAPGYWREHGEITQQLMRIVARHVGADEDLYGAVGLIHDVDYLKFPHDIPDIEGDVHPIPLVKALIEEGVHPAIGLAILEHAPYIGVNDSPTSRLSAALSGCEDLATLLAIKPKSSNIENLNANALFFDRRVGTKPFTFYRCLA